MDPRAPPSVNYSGGPRTGIGGWKASSLFQEVWRAASSMEDGKGGEKEEGTRGGLR